MKKGWMFILLLTLVFGMAACGDQSTAVPDGSDTQQEQATGEAGGAQPAAAVSQADIADTVWQWADLVTTEPASQSVVPNPENYEIVFNADFTANIRADCNVVAATYELNGTAISIQPGPSTLAFCGEESLDQLFLNTLSGATTAGMVDGRLQLETVDGAVASFNSAGPAGQTGSGAPVDPTSAIDTRWLWTDLVETAPAGQSVVPNSENYVLVFRADGTLNIQADCNSVIGQYQVDGDQVSIQLGPSTMAFCGEESLDQLFLSTLSSVTTGALEGDRIFLSTFDGARMGFNNGGPDIDIGMNPADVSLDTQGLPYSWQAQLVAGTPYDTSMPPGPMGLPDHLQITFGAAAPAEGQPGGPIMYIIPVDAYRQLWDDAGNDAVSSTINAIFELTNAIPFPPPTSGVPALPSEMIGGVNDLAVQLDRASVTNVSATKNGYRFVGRWMQDANPVLNYQMIYVYQGFTNDGKYLVSFWYPVTSPQIPNESSEVPQDELDLVTTDINAYLTQSAARLNALTPADWEPDLTTLDALVASLAITTVPSTGLNSTLWTLNGRLQADETVETFADPGDNWVVFHADDTLNYQADCNVGNGRYDATGGMLGRIAIELGITTLAACPEGSFGDLLVSTLNTTQDYKILPGGDLLALVLPDNGGALLFANAGPADVVGEGPEIDVPEPEPGVVVGTVTAPNGINVRTGPGSVYPVLGVAPEGTQGELIGRSADGQWLVADVPSAPNGQGWVAAAYVSVTGGADLPVIQAPPPPVPTATPTPVAPVIAFSANPTTLNQGQCTTLTWNVENIQAVWVYPQGARYTDFPVTGQGSRQECPRQTTTYEMRVLRTDGVVELRQVMVTVNVSNPLADTSWALALLNATESPPPGANITLNFVGTNAINGFAGCNDYSGNYQISGNSIIFSGVLSTGLACDFSEVESTYLLNLQNAVRYELRNNQLIIRDGVGNELLRFNRVG